MMLESRPDLYFQTPHYEGYPGVLVHLEAIDARRAEGAHRGFLADPGAEGARNDYLAGKSPSA